MFWIDVLSRIVHVSTAIALVGGSLFTLMVLLPSASELGEEPHKKLAAAIAGRWKKFVHIGVTLFLVSGLYNFVRAIPLHKGDGTYHMLIGIKMVLALFVFFLAAALVGRSEKLAGIRNARKKWLTVLVILAAVIVAISGYTKVRGVPAKIDTVNVTNL
ncbi:hypothetical protein Poly51_57160 [Rubripirellula tenax]|uniref:Copper resistance protein D n=1 Tax=Rubripirellula tenax TaxID=2528015 RepID=A0A5C6ECB5_9BACT|nr:hypothetical protein [Rubripirellula tenax]TWU46320.1 hypothetical protein Poly51_57160 [Rubripirellula tenax]